MSEMITYNLEPDFTVGPKVYATFSGLYWMADTTTGEEFRNITEEEYVMAEHDCNTIETDIE